MKRILSLGLLTIPLLGSCGFLQDQYDDHYDVYVDPLFTDAQQQVIQQSISQWITGLQDEVNLTITYHTAPANCIRLNLPPASVCLHYSSMAEMEALGQPLDTFTWDGLTIRDLDDSSDVWIAMDTIAEHSCPMSQVVEHEMGHAFGLEHTLGAIAGEDDAGSDGGIDPGALMYWNCGWPQARNSPTVIDYNQFLWLRNLTSQQLFVLYH